MVSESDQGKTFYSIGTSHECHIPWPCHQKCPSRSLKLLTGSHYIAGRPPITVNSGELIKREHHECLEQARLPLHGALSYDVVQYMIGSYNHRENPSEHLGVVHDELMRRAITSKIYFARERAAVEKYGRNMLVIDREDWATAQASASLGSGVGNTGQTTDARTEDAADLDHMPTLSELGYQEIVECGDRQAEYRGRSR